MSELYNPQAFKVEDPSLLADVIDAISFATLVSNGPDGPRASHLPFLLDRDAGEHGVLRGHLAGANGHLANLDGAPVLAIFHGPAYYVTPSWYASKAADGKVVPTWNYVMVHARGHAHLYRDRVRLRDLVGRLTEHMERHRAAPWAVSDAPADFVQRMVGQIVGIDLPIEWLEGKFKLGQNRSAADRATLAAGVAAELPAILEQLRSLPGHSIDL